MYYKYGRLKTNIVKNKRNVYLHSSFTTEWAVFFFLNLLLEKTDKIILDLKDGLLI